MKRQIIIAFLLSVSILVQTKIEKFGIMIHYDLGHTPSLNTFLQRLNNPQCNALQEINVIALSESAQEISYLKQELLNKDYKIPINFFISKQENQFRYRIPINSTAQIYYIATSNFTNQNCQKIGKAREIAQEKLIGNHIGIIGQADSTSIVSGDLTKKQPEVFSYSQGQSKHFAIVENIRIISRHLLQIAASNISEIVNMAKVMNPSCEQIFLNFVSSHFYPELRPSAYSFQDQTHDSNSEQQKTICVRKFIGILGYMPVFYQRKNFQKQIWINPNIEKILELKKLQLIGFLKNPQSPSTRRLQSPNQFISTSFTTQKKQQLKQYQQLILNILWYIVYFLLLVILILAIKYKYQNTEETCIKKSVNYI